MKTTVCIFKISPPPPSPFLLINTHLKTPQWHRKNRRCDDRGGGQIFIYSCSQTVQGVKQTVKEKSAFEASALRRKSTLGSGRTYILGEHTFMTISHNYRFADASATINSSSTPG